MPPSTSNYVSFAYYADDPAAWVQRDIYTLLAEARTLSALEAAAYQLSRFAYARPPRRNESIEGYRYMLLCSARGDTSAVQEYELYNAPPIRELLTLDALPPAPLSRFDESIAKAFASLAVALKFDADHVRAFGAALAALAKAIELPPQFARFHLLETD